MPAKVTLLFDAASFGQSVKVRWQKALPDIAAVVLADCNRYARDDTGKLIQSAYAASSLAQGKLIWRTPYARRVYYTEQASHANNANASLRWCERACALHLAQWESLVTAKLGGKTE